MMKLQRKHCSRLKLNDGMIMQTKKKPDDNEYVILSNEMNTKNGEKVERCRNQKAWRLGW